MTPLLSPGADRAAPASASYAREHQQPQQPQQHQRQQLHQQQAPPWACCPTRDRRRRPSATAAVSVGATTAQSAHQPRSASASSSGSNAVVEAAQAATVATTSTPATAAGSTLSSWEENFQDLSGWCMAGAQVRRDFRTGECVLLASELIGTRIEGGNILTTTEGAPKEFMQAIEKKTLTDTETIVGVQQRAQATCIDPPQFGQYYQWTGPQLQQEQLLFNNNNNNNNNSNNNNNNNNNNSISTKIMINDQADLRNSDKTWIEPTNKVDHTPGMENSVIWQELHDLGMSAVPAELQKLPLEERPMVKLEIKQDNQDMFQPFDTEASNGFDLLSYLCEDDVPSPGDSVSTDSSRITDSRSLPRLSSNSSAHIVVSPKTYEPIPLSPAPTTDTSKSHIQTSDSSYSQESPKPSSISSTSTTEATVSSSRSSQRQSSSNSSGGSGNLVKLEQPESPALEKRSSRTRRARTVSSSSSGYGKGKGKKRMLNDESDSDNGSYREIREKNNEASRKSRMNKKAKEIEMTTRALELEKDNRILKMKVEELEKLVTSMRNALLRSALKKEAKTNSF